MAEIKVIEKGPAKLIPIEGGPPPLSDQPEKAAWGWLVKFIQAGPDELTDLFTLRSGYREFALFGSPTEYPYPWMAGSPSPDIVSLHKFHDEFAESIRAVVEGREKTMWHMDLPPSGGWLLFHTANGLIGHFKGNWQWGFLSRVNALLARFGSTLKLCPGCSHIFSAEHGLQTHCSLQCSARHRQDRHAAKMVTKIRKLRGWQTKTLPALARSLGIPIPQARRYLVLAKKSEHENRPATGKCNG